MDRQPNLPALSCSSQSVFKVHPDKSTKGERELGQGTMGWLIAGINFMAWGQGHHKPSPSCVAQVETATACLGW